MQKGLKRERERGKTANISIVVSEKMKLVLVASADVEFTPVLR